MAETPYRHMKGRRKQGSWAGRGTLLASKGSRKGLGRYFPTGKGSRKGLGRVEEGVPRGFPAKKIDPLPPPPG